MPRHVQCVGSGGDRRRVGPGDDADNWGPPPEACRLFQPLHDRQGIAGEREEKGVEGGDDWPGRSLKSLGVVESSFEQTARPSFEAQRDIFQATDNSTQGRPRARLRLSKGTYVVNSLTELRRYSGV